MPRPLGEVLGVGRWSGLGLEGVHPVLRWKLLLRLRHPLEKPKIGMGVRRPLGRWCMHLRMRTRHVPDLPTEPYPPYPALRPTIEAFTNCLEL